jgi:acyl-CoA thioesterase I
MFTENHVMIKLQYILASSLILIFICCVPIQAVADTRILFLGDSITAGYGIEKEKAYPALVGSAMAEKGFNDIQIINAGISGSTSASAMSRLKWYSRIQPHVLVLALGGNDGLRGISVESMKSNLEKTIQFALAKGMKVILAGMQMPPNYGERYTTDFRKVYRVLASSYPITFMPFLLEDVGGKPELNLPDGIHPTPEGHRLIAAKLLPYLLENL